MDSLPSREPRAALMLPAPLGRDAADVTEHDYHPELSTPALIVELRRQLGSERRTGRLVCRYLADLADRLRERRDGELTEYVDELHAAACFFDLGARETRERVRIGRALRGLPHIEAAFVAGELSFSKVREVTRVACEETESAWLALARNLDMRALERHVARSRAEPRPARPRAAHDADGLRSDGLRSDALGPGARGSEAELGASEPAPSDRAAPASRVFDVAGATAQLVPSAHATPTHDGAATHLRIQPGRSPAPSRSSTRRAEPGSVRVTFELSMQAWALLERALEDARRRATTQLSDAEALEVVARASLHARDAVSDGSFADASAGDRPLETDIDSEPAIGETTTHVETTMDPAARLLAIIGGRCGWGLDELGHESGMSVPELQHALLLLELGGHIRRSSGSVDPAR